MTLSIILCGSNGRMGQTLKDLAPSMNIEIVAQIDRFTDYKTLPTSASAVLDFSLPEGTQKIAVWASHHKIPLISGVTGHNSQQMDYLRHASKCIPIIVAPNFSLGIQILLNCVTIAIKNLDAPFQLSISETHHLHKKDTPSGTALYIKDRLQSMDQAHLDLKITSHRLEHAIGTHMVSLELAQERIEFMHVCKDRVAFAAGALKIVPWITKQSSGWYTIEDFIKTN